MRWVSPFICGSKGEGDADEALDLILVYEYRDQGRAEREFYW